MASTVPLGSVCFHLGLARSVKKRHTPSTIPQATANRTMAMWRLAGLDLGWKASMGAPGGWGMGGSIKSLKKCFGDFLLGSRSGGRFLRPVMSPPPWDLDEEAGPPSFGSTLQALGVNGSAHPLNRRRHIEKPEAAVRGFHGREVDRFEDPWNL